MVYLIVHGTGGDDMTSYPPQRTPTARDRADISSFGESIGARLKELHVTAPVAEIFCPLCPQSITRRYLTTRDAWAHIKDRHSIHELTAITPADMQERIEDGLIQIVNSTSHEAAIKIAEALLLGEPTT